MNIYLYIYVYLRGYFRSRQYLDGCVAYHGTVSRSVLEIMLKDLRRPGEEKEAVLHGQAGSHTCLSIEYAGHPAYAQFFEIGDSHWAQLVFQCRVRPGSFRERYGTLGNKHWEKDVRFDRKFKNMDSLEWL